MGDGHLLRDDTGVVFKPLYTHACENMYACVYTHTLINLRSVLWAGRELALQLRAYHSHSTHIGQLTTTCNSRSGGSGTFFCPPLAPAFTYTFPHQHMYMTQLNTFAFSCMSVFGCVKVTPWPTTSLWSVKAVQLVDSTKTLKVYFSSRVQILFLFFYHKC